MQCRSVEPVSDDFEMLRKMCMKIPTLIVAAALCATSAASEAEARGRGGAVAAGIIGGLAVGALAGAAIAEADRDDPYDDYGYYPAYRRGTHVHIYHRGPSDDYGGAGGYSYEEHYSGW